MERDWIVGERVAVIQRRKVIAIRQVTRLTKTQVVLNKGERYRRVDGLRSADPFDQGRIEPLTNAHIAEVEKKQIIQRIYAMDWEEVGIEFLRQIDAVLSEFKTFSREA